MPLRQLRSAVLFVFGAANSDCLLVLPDPVAALSLALLLACTMLLRQCLGAPLAGLDLRLTSPCGETSRPSAPSAPNRHIRHPSKPLRRVKSQIDVLSAFFNMSVPTIDKLYGQAKDLGVNYNYHWLPNGQMKWYKNKIHCLSGKDRAEKVLPVLHESLQKYAITLQAMLLTKESDFHVREDVHPERRALLEELSQWHKAVLCEVETAIRHEGLPVPQRATSAILPEDRWDVKPDYTGMLIRDWGVISRYRTFITDWYHIMLKVVKNSSCNKGQGRKRPRKSMPT